MAHWHKLEKTEPLQTKHGCIDKVIHVWPHPPHPEHLVAWELGQRLIHLFKEDLLVLMARRTPATSAARDFERGAAARTQRSDQAKKKPKKKGDMTSPN